MIEQDEPDGGEDPDIIRAGNTALSHVHESPAGWALFLDIDGTLIDLAETPDAIDVPQFLGSDLSALSAKMSGALALVTGRSLAYADKLFPPYRFPIAGLHGAERRMADGTVLPSPITPAFQALKATIAREAENLPGVLIEDKGAAIAAHYRLAPEHRMILEERMNNYSRIAGPHWTLQMGKMVIELRPASASKGLAIEAFMREAPFHGRLPLAIGDDLTDEAMFRAANALGGSSIRMGPRNGETEAQASIASPTLLREMIAKIAARPSP